MHHAVEAGAVDALRILIAAGADATIANAQGQRPMDTAMAGGNQEVIQLLEAAPKKP